MIKAERQSFIKEMVEREGTLSVHEIAAHLEVSEMTVRRDLEELSMRGELVRVHGGARSAEAYQPSMLRREYSHVEKRNRNVDEKAAVAARAVQLIEPNTTIFLGTGTTVEQMIPLLPSYHLRIVVNSLAIFNMLEARNGYELCLIGGTFRPRTGAFVGPLAEDAISKLGLDAAFVGANGISDGGVFTSNADEGRFQQIAFDRADARYLVADASKIGKRDFFEFYQLMNLDALVCDAAISERARKMVDEFTEVLV